MARFAYRTDHPTMGVSDLRFVSDDYVAEANEVIIDGDTLPPIESLPGYIKPTPLRSAD